MRAVALGSGSRGNALVVESSHGRLLVDVGFSCREIVKRLRGVGLEPQDLDAVVLTHEHSDHVRGVDVLVRRFGLPVYATPGTLEGSPFAAEVAARVQTRPAGEPFVVAGFQIETFLIPHDAREPVGLVIEDGDGCRLGLAADIGYRSRLAWARLQRLQALVLETNHDLDMLRNGPYPWHLKQRVAGRHGHLSNADAAEGLPELLHDDLQWVVLYHLSQTNNLPALAAAVIGEALDREGATAQVVVSSQSEPTSWIEVT